MQAGRLARRTRFKVQSGGDGEFAGAGDQVDVVLAANLVDAASGEGRAPQGRFFVSSPVAR